MRLAAESGAWVTGPSVAEPPAVAVLEVSGAVLEWTVDDPRGAAATRLVITDVAAADWLWRVVGVDGHAAIVAALDGAPDGAVRDLAGVELVPEAVAPLRRLGLGHWLRRWWPESSRDGIVALDEAVLDGELAVLTEAAGEFFTTDTVDSDVAGLLAPHQGPLHALERGGDPRVVALVRACLEIADDAGVWADDTPAPAPARRGDYALAAGPDGGRGSGAIAAGTGSVDWVTVPANAFDAAEGTVDWAVRVADGTVVAAVRVATVAGDAGGRSAARGIGVRVEAGAVRGDGTLDANGVAALPLLAADGRALTENQAWDHDWSTATVTVGSGRPSPPDAAALRARVRDVARARLARPGPDAFLAEVLAAESDY